MSLKLYHPWQLDVKLWESPISFEDWSQIVCGDMVANPIELRKYYAASWDAADCREFLLIHKRLKRKKIIKPLKSRVVTLDEQVIRKRFAVALWRECLKLLTRRMTPSARQLVCDTKEQMEKAAGIQLGIDTESP